MYMYARKHSRWFTIYIYYVGGALSAPRQRFVRALLLDAELHDVVEVCL